tara:strand:+ start:1536 stop:1751 length:216 start_codon:yes stop_codon:yes gene_type:complete
MENLIAALQLINSKMSKEVRFPTLCIHDEFRVFAGVEQSDFTAVELTQLSDWGFDWDEDDECFVSGWYGSC